MSEKEEMILLTEALEILEQELAGISLPVETVPVRQALGGTVAEDQISSLDIPPFNKSAMDGYAVLDGDQREEYRLLETVAAGAMPTMRLTPGTCTKVMTGAPVPHDAGRVIMVEHTNEANGIIRILSHNEARNICRKAEDVRSGDIILHAPTVLGPLEIANLIAVGITEVKVTKPIRIAILATGNEIVDSPAQLQPGKIMNSNGPILEGLCRKYLLDVTTNTIVEDNRNTTVSAIREALNNADIVVLSGGVSVGDYDFVTDAMKQG
jgi:molybdopterin molybdotransferase